MPEQDGRKARKAAPGPKRRPAGAMARKAEPAPVSVYAASLHPDDAAAAVLASGHAVGGHPGLAAGVSN